MPLAPRTSSDGSTTLQPSAPEALHAQVHELLPRNSPGYDEARSSWNGMIHDAVRRDLNVLLQKGETA